MTIEEAIRTAIALEKQVHAFYVAAASKAVDLVAKRVFQALATEELGHVTYLERRLAEWLRDGCLSLERLKSILPPLESLQERVHARKDQTGRLQTADTADLEALRGALRAEDETTGFYRRMVLDLPAEGQSLFFRFLDIEDGHTAVVAAQIESITKYGRWFDLVDGEATPHSVP